MDEKILNNIRYRRTSIRNYWVSEYGDIINMDNKENKTMKQMTTRDGHKRIELKIKKGVGKKFFVHRLVYEAFVGELIDGLVIEHLDSNSANNYYLNLKQSTQATNIQTAIKNKSFGRNNCKKLVLFEKQSKVAYLFEDVKTAVKFVNLSGSNVGRLKRSSRVTKKYYIIECDNKGQTTIETIMSSLVDMNNGVEYTSDEISIVEVRGN